MRSLDVARNVVRRAVVFIPRGTVAAALLGKGPVVTAWRASEQRRTFFSKEKSKSVYEYGAHRSDAEELIAEVPIVMVDGEVALCDGGGGALGHPLDYVQVHNANYEPRECRYCGIRYQMKRPH